MLKLLMTFLLFLSFALAAGKKIEPATEGIFKEEIAASMDAIERKLILLDQKVRSSTLETKKNLSKKIEEAKNLSKEKWENVKSSVKDVMNEIEAKLDYLIDG